METIMNLKNIKKSLVFTLILGLLAGNTATAMNFNFDNLNVQTARQAFLLGLFTPQTPSFGHISTILTALVSLKNTLKPGNLNNLVYNKNNYTVLKAPAYGIPLYINYAAYVIGYLLRLHITRVQATFPPKAPSNIYFGLLDTLGSMCFHGACAGILAYNIWAPGIDSTYKRCLTSLCLETLGTTQSSDNVQQLKNLKNMINEGAEIDHLNPHPLALALENNIPELKDILIKDAYKKPENMFQSEHFEILIKKNEQELCTTLFNSALTMYEQNPREFTLKLIDTFATILQSFANPSSEELAMLEQLLEQIQTMDNDPSHYQTTFNPYGMTLFQKSYDARFAMVGRMLQMNYDSVITYTPNPTYTRNPMDNDKRLHTFTKYLIETGMPIYSYEANYFFPLATKCETFDAANNNPVMQAYLKMVGFYNKTLLTDKENLETFLRKLTATEQDEIFRLAATRGHMFTLDILRKIDSKKYSYTEAVKIAVKRRCKKALTKYLSFSTEDTRKMFSMFSENTDKKEFCSHFEKALTSKQDLEFFKKIKDNVINNTELFDKKFDTANDMQKFTIITCIRDMIKRDPTRFDAMVAQFQQSEPGILSSLKN